MKKYFNHDAMESKVESGERIVSQLNTVIHCHHYNSRLQKTIESSELINGKQIIKKAAAKTFAKQIKNSIKKWEISDLPNKLTAASELYSFLGFGVLNFDQMEENIVSSGCSHFVEGWKSGYKQDDRKVCTFVEGYLEGALHAVYNKNFTVVETACMNEGAHACQFKVQLDDSKKDWFAKDYILHKVNTKSENSQVHPKERPLTNVDMLGIPKAVSGMPLFGNDKGIIPAFNVYLAHMPRDFYNLVSIEFSREMELMGMGEIARGLLEEDAETCALNTFAGIMQSEEWAALIQPMIKTTEDNLFALVAVSNALGWGVTHVAKHTPYESLELRTSNGYESVGGLEIVGRGSNTECPMLSGVAAGLMELVYGSGDYECRKGSYKTEETQCIARGDLYCSFETHAAALQKKDVA